MTTLTGQEETPASVAQIATQDVDLPRETLLGLFGKEQSMKALVRTSTGKIETLKVGDRMGGKTVAAISAEGLVLARSSGQTTVLKMPQG